MSRPAFYIRVTKASDGTIKREVFHNGEKIADVSFVEIVEMIMQFSSSLRYEAVK